MTAPLDDTLLQHDDDAVRVLRLNRPHKRNALDTALTRRLCDALEAADADDAVRAIVLGGVGESFCAGADVTEFRDLGPANPAAVDERANLTTRLHRVLADLAKPVVAAVRGPAMGGGAGLALACDLVVMARDATLGYPEIRLGIVPAVVMVNLVRQVGRKAAFELVGLGLPVDAAQASAWGLVNRVVDSGQVDDEALALARQLAARSPQAMAATKDLMRRVADLSFDDALGQGRLVNVAMRAFRR
jgi:enoyl-CoA hydratase/carnithine racemase